MATFLAMLQQGPLWASKGPSTSLRYAQDDPFFFIFFGRDDKKRVGSFPVKSALAQSDVST